MECRIGLGLIAKPIKIAKPQVKHAQRMALYLQDKHPINTNWIWPYTLKKRGFSEIWQADTRLARDCIVMMSALLARTRRMRFGSGVLPIWTRNPAVIAATWSTMWELAGKVDGLSRVMLGIGAWWEPIAGRVGVHRTRPLKAMREHVEVLRQLFTMEEVTYQGEFVHLDRIRLDVAFGDASRQYRSISRHRRQISNGQKFAWRGLNRRLGDYIRAVSWWRRALEGR
jgi:hypothetical protein